MARAALALSLVELANLSGVSEKTIRRYESIVGVVPGSDVTHQRLSECFEKHGVEFAGSDGEGWVSVKVTAAAEPFIREQLNCLGPVDDATG